MARKRQLRPELFQGEELMEVSAAAQWTFFGLLTQADDDGRLGDNGCLLNADLWPLRPEHTAIEMARDLRELIAAGLLCRYTAGSESLLHLIGFRSYQRSSGYSPSKRPACPTHP
ncbi:hypothetical protein GTQ99_02405 [Kineococcus sp. T13]|uniref:hypothetical protein n=1 Tax=Kineococcus vitellinus TaxID=2696565 RepID=UPI001412464A|nr:hypothetical protein [Kineococcus vitellinus]NAZ74280.1 hypothetical protein [Kineococcus vitellinus]